ncbi:MAG: hypothetical protein SFV55_16695 [Haliscomenobacter sp.]|uniref:leucine-rich repeat domain-containing protein n=1 Tax=Haliscomenobacter sp. TaxID=2717303 RepID=UPI0029B09639|nr:leucine-rich repeat domain-containing protein [Haliscomenobacter sp.]MDX2070068.1 hypothetical protein [Haliscomenobacter sp.]
MQIETGNLDTIPRLHWAAFRQAYPGDEHLHLACHAAFPIALTTDLLYKIWLNFRNTSTAEDPLELLSTVSDLLHSDLCREVGRDMYEMQPDIRELLISTLQTSEVFGEARIFELARFLRDYLQYNPEKIPTLAFKEAQNWLVASYLEPEKAAKLILDLLQQEEENPDAGIKIDYFLSWAKERNKLNQVSSSTGDALLTAEQMVLGIRQYKAGDFEGALERLKPFQELFMEGEEKVGKGFKTKIPTEVWSALRPPGYESKPRSLALERIEQVKINKARSLDLRNCGLTEIPTELSELPWLEELILSENKNLKDISILAALPNLKMLNLYDTQVNNISPLSNLVHLEDLVLARTAISDLSPLSGLMNLKILNANETQITELFPLITLSDLTEIDISRTNVEDLMPLRELKKIKKINCSETNIHNLSFANNLLYLQEIRVSSTLISDLSPLQNLKKIELLYIANTYVTNITPIIPLLELQLTELNIVGCDLDEPPNEIANEGIGAILEYFRNKNALTGNVGDDNLKKEASNKSERDSYSEYGIPMLILAFFNELGHHPLPNLAEEAKSIQDLMAQRVAKKDFTIHIDQFVSNERIPELLSLYRDNIELFHYSSYFGSESSLFERHSFSIAKMLGECPRLKLVILNGFATGGQVQLLLNAGVPAVIATNSAITDNSATDFAIQFFRSLVNGHNLREAFKFARAFTMTKSTHIPDIQISRGLETHLISGEKEPLWGLFYRDVKVLDWELPQSKSQFIKENPNDYLIQNLIEALSSYVDSFRKLNKRLLWDEKPSSADLRRAVLENFPHPISERIRYLLVPTTEQHEYRFDILSRGRLKMIIETFEITLMLTGCIYLAELYDYFLRSKDEDMKSTGINEIRNFVRAEGGFSAYNVVNLIIAVHKSLDNRRFRWFISELKDLGDQFKEHNSILRQEIDYMQVLTSNQNSFSQTKVEEQCLIAERALSTILSELAFLSTYLIISVKEINVLKNRQNEIKYKMNIVRFVQSFVGLEPEPYISDTPWENSSVIMLKKDDSSDRYLSLSPFMIDQNAFDEKSTTGKLHIFVGYSKEKDTYAYQHVYMSNDPLLFISNQRNFQIIKDQFEAFSKLVFDEPMKQL